MGRDDYSRTDWDYVAHPLLLLCYGDQHRSLSFDVIADAGAAQPPRRRLESAPPQGASFASGFRRTQGSG
jgi:hypothetical protein